MGSCFSVGVESGGGSQRKKPTETSQVAPADDAVQPPAASEVATSEVIREAAHADLISNQQHPERHIHCNMMSYDDLYKATEGFRYDLFLGEGGFGPVYRGFLDRTNQEVAIKILNLQGRQGDEEFLAEVMILGKLCHPNLVKLHGCCVDRHQRLLVYEYMPLGSLSNHIHDLPPGKQPLDWGTRIEILLGTAKGLQYLHDKVKPPVINRDVKCGNILLGEGYHPKLADFGLAKLGPTGDKTHISTRVMGTAGYCAPEYILSGRLTMKSDIYSFGVVMLEVLTGRKAQDEYLPAPEQNLAVWAATLVNTRNFSSRDLDKVADPALQGQYHKASFFQALLVAVLCVSETPGRRPRIAEVVDALTEFSERHKERLARQQLAAPRHTI